ncbi:unnamed protein product [Protopolystoma xenopodis]|uniref:Uncharacterized protein n=1 Tax=Protopolystoma xenopodis TaxID=117903 RepID=A0A448WE25_9PLAT|nr:unnamed protein product [Protopolystoma xenopodis]
MRHVIQPLISYSLNASLDFATHAQMAFGDLEHFEEIMDIRLQNFCHHCCTASLIKLPIHLCSLLCSSSGDSNLKLSQPDPISLQVILFSDASADTATLGLYHEDDTDANSLVHFILSQLSYYLCSDSPVIHSNIPSVQSANSLVDHRLTIWLSLVRLLPVFWTEASWGSDSVSA